MKIAPLFKTSTPAQTCPVCKQIIMDGFEYYVVHHIGCSTIQDVCCSTDCVQEYKLNLLREEGL